VFLNRRELEVRKIHFSVELAPGEVDFQSPTTRQSSILFAEGTAELLNETLGEIRVWGKVRVGMEADCDRCLDPVPVQLENEFDLFYRPSEFEADDAEHAIKEGEAEIGYYEGDGIELNEILREHILLSLPMQQICRESCQGICPLCGKNRNLAECQCEARLTDDRWSALRHVRESLKPATDTPLESKPVEK
jgi:uncharacterized protein